MQIEKCKNHPLNNATGICKRCHEPLCNRCKIQLKDGVFCSDVCLDLYRSLQNSIHDQFPRSRKKRISITGLIMTLAGLAAGLAVIYGILVFGFRTTDFGEMMHRLYGMIKAAF